MIRRTCFAVVVCLTILLGAGAWAAEEAVKIEYKFTPGEILRYKLVVDMNMAVQSNIEQNFQIPAMQIQMVAVMRMKTLGILPNGDAKVLTSIDSMKMKLGGVTQEVPPGDMPAVTMIMSPNGVVKQVGGLEQAGGMFAQMPFAELTNFAQYGAFPTKPLELGSTWVQNVQFPLGGTVRMQSQLTSANSKVGKYRVAEIEQHLNGNIDMDMPKLMFAPQGQGADAGVDMSMKGTVVSDSTLYFSVEQGKAVRTDGTGDVLMAMNISGGPANGQMRIAMDMKFEMFLLPGK